ncbi:MAG: hypothetical protein J1F33_06405 [Clostridiales bacterium]|nr:hypothetical protein [Clostridiales bacterium]
MNEILKRFVGKAVLYKNRPAYVERVTAEYVYVRQATEFGVSFYRLVTGSDPHDNAVERGEVVFDDPSLTAEFINEYAAAVAAQPDKK